MQAMNDDVPAPIIIALSKTKILLIAAGSLAFALLSAWILFTKEPDPRLNSPRAKAAGMAGIVFFGFCGAFAVWKCSDSKPGLIIDAEGIIDNSSAIAAGRVRWSDITGFSVSKIQGTRILNILVASPESYVAGKGWLSRMAGAANIKLVGTPINISSHSLKIDFDELARQMSEAAIRYSRPPS